MKTMNKVIAAMMIVAITAITPAMAGNKKYGHYDKKVVVVTDKKSNSHFDKVHKELNRFDKIHAYRPDTRTCTFRVSRYESHKALMYKAENLKGVMDTKWNPRTREVTVIYDAKVTSARNIRHFMA